MDLTAANLSTGPDRLRIRVQGAVQGVGFRPFVYGLAARYGLAGFVLNDQDGVLAEIEGASTELFLSALSRERPTLSRIDTIDVTRLPALGRPGFAIRESLTAGPGVSLGIADAATCPACLKDLFDPASRFHLYPFVTCTDCGPRVTITRRAPYDRANTTMSDFKLCGPCAAEYGDPNSRRFHAETIACPACGPALSHPVAEMALALAMGGIVALKGVGGFHLFCDATNEMAVRRLRNRKHRPARPLAIMVGDDASLSPFAKPTPADRTLLSSSARPIVLVQKGAGLAASVAPGLGRIGVMLPSAPVHHLLFRALNSGDVDGEGVCALVVTSANLAGEPLVIDNAAAMKDLAFVADLIVTHDRAILQRADDSVMAMIDGAPAFIRRGRGFVPDPIDLGEDGPEVVAVGAHLKATVCVTRGREAFVSQHLGDLNSAETVRFYQHALRRLIAHLGVKPQLFACDLHPDYRTTLIAEGLAAESLGLPALGVQHHAAHLAAVAAEHHLRRPLIGVALDGHGYGTDGATWGGELMHGEGGAWRRVGHLSPLAMPGGDRAAREPWRMGLAAMIALGRSAEAADRFSIHPLAASLAEMTLSHPNALLTTSMGRLFDAAAALLGVCEEQTYEGQAAMELEALVGVPTALPSGFRVDENVLDFRPLLSALIQPGLGAHDGAALFHGTLIAGLAEWIGGYAAETDTTDVVLGGGCFMNRILADGLAQALRHRGLRPWLARAVPANDGGISLGQAAVARAHLMAGVQQSATT
jgi:hydrogenase maturation protein HypF